ncbi:MAG: hypothetical protein IJQ62_12695 [Clostridia bacterium]|nr:hypothetical protein [Clostridia bacterium]
MDRTLELNGHTENELCDAIVGFFDKKGMSVAHEYDPEKGIHVLNANTREVGFYNGLLGGDTKCYVTIKNNGDGKVAITAGKGNWTGKLTGAAITVATYVAVPIWGIINGLWTVINATGQFSLPESVGVFAEGYLATGDNAGTRKLAQP